MLGIRITRESTLHQLDDWELELRAEIRAAAKYGAIPQAGDKHHAWVTRKEVRLATLDAVRALVMQLAPDSVLLEEEA